MLVSDMRGSLSENQRSHLVMTPMSGSGYHLLLLKTITV